MPDGTFSNFKLGKTTKRIDGRTLKLAKYLPQLPPIPAGCGWTRAMREIGMLGNDTAGDCVEAGYGHLVESWTANTGSEFVFGDNEVIDSYSSLTGYVPGNESTDRGTDMLTALNYWRQTGLSGHKIKAFAEINPANLDQLRAAIYLFGGAYVGVNLPVACMRSSVWDSTSGPYAGGHCIPLLDYCAAGWFWCITWGQIVPCSAGFIQANCDEAYACVSSNFLNRAGETPVGFDLASLNADLAAVCG